MKRREPLYLCGPTAVGKSAVAIELAQRLKGEIISVDSMQVYRGMDIGTAKPSIAERQGIPHFLIDVSELNEIFDAARFVHLANDAETEIQSRGSLPIYCGGTGLYFNALLQGLGEAPASDPQLRGELESTPLAILLEELEKKDAKAFDEIDRKNPRRVVRAIEVIRLTGKPFSEQRANWEKIEARIVGLEMDREDLKARIDRRVDEMFRRDLVEETRALLARGLRENRTASQALGYKQVIEHLDGKQSLKESVDLVKLRTRQFAKRQMTWFKRQLPVQWLKIEAGEAPVVISDRLIDIHKLV